AGTCLQETCRAGVRLSEAVDCRLPTWPARPPAGSDPRLVRARRAREGRAREPSGGRGRFRDGGSLERELAVASLDEDRVALAEAALEERRRERVLDEPLQRSLERTRPVRRVPPGLP